MTSCKCQVQIWWGGVCNSLCCVCMCTCVLRVHMVWVAYVGGIVVCVGEYGNGCVCVWFIFCLSSPSFTPSAPLTFLSLHLRCCSGGVVCVRVGRVGRDVGTGVCGYGRVVRLAWLDGWRACFAVCSLVRCRLCVFSYDWVYVLDVYCWRRSAFGLWRAHVVIACVGLRVVVYVPGRVRGFFGLCELPVVGYG